MIRNFVLRDLPTLNRYRRRGQFLDTATAVTWGATVVPAGALLTHLAPATGIFTYLSSPREDSREIILAQLVHQQGANSARFSFLAPESALESPDFNALVEYMSQQIGERGAHNLIAEVEEGSPMFESMRRIGFAVYARQRIWHLEIDPNGEDEATSWRPRLSQDEIPIRTLYNAIVPGLTQQVETPPWERQKGVAFRVDGEVRAYVDLQYGPRGILAHPYFHPDIEDLAESLAELLVAIPNRRSRPIYMKVRTYQGWLEGPLEDQAATPGPRQAVMVKRLVVPIMQGLPETAREIKGATTANPTLPFARSFSSPENGGNGDGPLA
ncbi:MAG: hypothetical protein R3335_02865 [Anaerolineales bacterium]|nr:hypothetical protein [Anaerolineales bacterium]